MNDQSHERPPKICLRIFASGQYERYGPIRPEKSGSKQPIGFGINISVWHA